MIGLLDQQQPLALVAGAALRAEVAARQAASPRRVPILQDPWPAFRDLRAEATRSALSPVRVLDYLEIDCFVVSDRAELAEPNISSALARNTRRAEEQKGFDDPSRRELVSRLEAIRDLVHKEQISVARKLLAVIPTTGSEQLALTKLRRALALPQVRVSPRTDVDRTQAYDWLRQHRQAYKGQWVAVGGDGLVAAAPTLRELNAQLRQLRPAEQPLVHKL